MIRKVKRKRHRFFDQKGSFTIEATLIFPFICIVMIGLILFTIFVYQKAVLGYWAETTAERLAYTWNNSYKQIETGAFTPEQQDGLYWRLTQDGGLSLLGLQDQRDLTIQLPVNEHQRGNGLIARKLYKAGVSLPAGIDGSIAFDTNVLERVIRVELRGRMKLPSFVRMFFNENDMKASTEYTIAEPTEFIRTIDLVRSYAGEVGRRISTRRARQLMQEPAPAEEKRVVVSSHKEAVAYVRRMTKGAESAMDTQYGKRTIDALDAQGVIHQAYYHFTESQIRQQLRKDHELLRTGSTQGVVWHFFHGSKKPSVALLNELSRMGIVVIVHS